MIRPKRTRQQVDSLVREVALLLAAGETVKTAAARLGVPYDTMTNMMGRYRRRHGIESVFQLVAVVVKEERL